MLKSVFWIIKVVFAGVLSIVILSVIAFFYDYTGCHISNTKRITDYKWESNQWISNMTEGVFFHYVDERGFNNQQVFDESETDILLMGSSHMEAFQVPVDANVGSLLNDKMSGLSVYNIGISGHTIYRCIDNLANAVSVYNNTKYIIIETDRVALDVTKMNEVIQANAEAIKSYDNGMIYYIQRYVPAVKWIYQQAKEWVNVSISTKAMLEVPKSNVSESYEEILEDFLLMASKAGLQNKSKIIIFYQPPTEIDSKGSFCNTTDNYYLKTFEAACAKNNIIFVDMTQDFIQLYNKQHILAHGFSNSAVGVGHLNRYGHEVIANRLALIINNLEIEGE